MNLLLKKKHYKAYPYGICIKRIKSKGKPIITHKMDMIFTHFGISGPAVLRCSQFIVKELKKSTTSEVMVSLDIFPEKNEEAIFQEIPKILKKSQKRA